jgi:hypothetical protein
MNFFLLVFIALIMIALFVTARSQNYEERANDTNRTRTSSWVRGLMVGHGLLTVVPIPVLLFYLNAMAFRAQQLIGHWPQPMSNDPKWIGEDDVLYQRLYDIIEFNLMPAVAWSLIAWLVLSCILFHSYSPKQRWFMMCLYLSMWSLLIFEPGGCLEWYLD